jgi:hypothetical protein
MTVDDVSKFNDTDDGMTELVQALLDRKRGVVRKKMPSRENSKG